MKQYIEQYDFEDPKISKDFIEVVREIVSKEVRKLKFNKMYPAKVVSVDGSLANIKLLGGNETISNIKNKTGETLDIDDEVYIEAINNSLNNIYIAIKK